MFNILERLTMIEIKVFVASFALALSCGFAYADVVFDGRFNKSDFSGYRALETDGAFFSGLSMPNGIPAHLDRVLDPAGSGKLVMRATHVVGDMPTFGGYRSELSASRDPVGSERWYSWGYFLPDTFKAAKNDIVIAQIHDTSDIGESDWRSPTLAVFAQDERFILMNAFDSDRVTSRSGTISEAGVDYERRELTSWDIETGKWVYLDLHVKWAGDETGFLEFWKDGVLLFKESNHINTFDDERGVWFKSGVYWSPNPEFISTYFSGVKIGDENETFQSMTMSAVPEPSVYLMMMVGLVGVSFFSTRGRPHLSQVAKQI